MTVVSAHFPSLLTKGWGAADWRLAERCPLNDVCIILRAFENREQKSVENYDK